MYYELFMFCFMKRLWKVFRENKHHSFILLYGSGHWVVGHYNATSMFTFPSEVKRVAWPFVRGFHDLNKYSLRNLFGTLVLRL